ncbi:neutral/alkaline nonlysosomal ceramidase [Moesziomyces antarcticus]|uniref:Neutral ceramidase n=1 Tax=Pseudozyma antarctica TaxID=84753 RepID=A0A5C3FGK7_PSEA2|nr:neutral/alkaline nonlysosomal ceramidase [Moesziomyces antarcticus]GAK62301.1 neutral/alkaline nonlysosomal ceramidase [Moesziomyces antarcticus]SPO42845.1 related to neutral ceramidase [Moesziomyces antarcticus]
MAAAGYQLVPSRDSEETCVSEGDAKAAFKEQQLPVPVSIEGTGVNSATRRNRRFLLLKAVVSVLLLGSAAVAACCAYRSPSFQAVWTDRPITPHVASSAATDQSVNFGVGIGDVTGPVVEVNMMGYASLPQTNTGLHIRLRSRAFIVGSAQAESPSFHARLASRFKSFIPTADGAADRWIFINSDICMGDSALRKAVVDRLRQEHPGLYGERNVAFVGTHSHAGPGGFMQALLPTLTSKGVILQNFDAIVEGTVRAALRAHDDYQARSDRIAQGAGARLSYGKTRLEDAHIQRSRYAYEQNPQHERDLYNDEDQDHDFSLLKFEDLSPNDEQPASAAGFLSWYAVHGTSLYENNTLTSGDNKGLAALLYESAQQPDQLPGQNSFVAGFSQALVGDTSPNTKGAWCDDGSKCEHKHSTCSNSKGQDRVQTCHGRGPAWGHDEYIEVSPTGSYDFASNEMIARKQVDAARSIMERDPEATGHVEDEYERTTMLTGPVKSVKMNVDMSQYTVYRPDGTRVKTCPAALGYGFAGGTTDGPGAFDFVQGSNKTDHHNPFWDVVKGFIKNPGPEQIECQAPKAVLLDIGEIHKPYDWGPSVVEVQMLRVGQLFILIVPGEFTTMAGRRLKRAVSDAIVRAGLLPEGMEPIVQVSGPASTYGHYVTTEEEYSVQRYEGASTLFGPHTLEAYMDVFSRRLVPALREGARDLPVGPQRAFDIQKAWKFKTGVVYDNPPIGHAFGDVLEQPLLSYPIPNRANATLFNDSPVDVRAAPSNISVTFVASNPRNNLRLEGTYFEVQRYSDRGEWVTERTDGHHSTTMRWTRTNELHGSSKIQISWAVEAWTQQGLYRIVYYGDRKAPFTGKISPFQATSAEFYLV